MEFKPFQSDTIGEISEAIVNAQRDYKSIPKTKTAGKPGGKQWTYADLTDVLEAMLPILSKHGLAFTQREQTFEGKIYLVTMLSHKKTGEWIGSFKPLNPSDATDQAYGSCMSYQRRYATYAILGIHPSDEDDDGQAAKDAQMITEKQLSYIQYLLKEHDYLKQEIYDRLRITSFDSLTSKSASEVIKWIERKTGKDEN
jgi:hypothetical protein